MKRPQKIYKDEKWDERGKIKEEILGIMGGVVFCVCGCAC